MDQTEPVHQQRRQAAQLWVGTVAALLAVVLPVAAALLSGLDTSSSFQAENARVLGDHEQRERLAATLHVFGLLGTIVLIGVVAARLRWAYPTFAPVAAGIFLVAGAGFVLLRLLGPVGFAALTLLDRPSPNSGTLRFLESVVMIAGPVSLLFAALAAVAVALAQLVEDAGGFAHLALGVLLLLLGGLSLSLDRDPEGRWMDVTFTRAGGPLTTAGLVLVAVWAVWLARRPAED